MKPVPQVPEKHLAIAIEYAGKVLNGEIAAKHWVAQFRLSTGTFNTGPWLPASSPQWDTACEYRLVKGPNHPDNVVEPCVPGDRFASKSGMYTLTLIRFDFNEYGFISENFNVFDFNSKSVRYTDAEVKAGKPAKDLKKIS